MNIGFDSKRLFHNTSGLGNYSRTLVRNLIENHPNNNYQLYTPSLESNIDLSFANQSNNLSVYTPGSRFKKYWRRKGVIKDLLNNQVQIYHGLSNELPIGISKTNIKSVVTIHDLIFRILPHTYKFFDRLIDTSKFKSSCKEANKIIAISNSTKTDLVNYFNIPEDKIEVIYQSCNPIYFNDISSENNKTLNLPNEYFLFVGSFEARKNIELIIETYPTLATQYQIPFVIVGKDQKHKATLIKRIQQLQLQDKFIWLENIDNDADLKNIYKNAQALIYPSLYEGFGIPVIEALLSNTPVITSKTSSLPEAGGPNSIYINPTSTEELKAAIEIVLDDSELRNKMIVEGRKYALHNFSAEKTSHELIKLYNNLI